MTVSVIMPAYNASRFLKAAIDSVLAQTFTDLELIVVNDGSTDRTGEILKGYGRRITVVDQPNRGLPAARNAGIARAAGQWVAFLDADDVWDADKLRVQLQAACADDSVIHCNARVIDADGAVSRPQMVRASENPVDLPSLVRGNRVLVLTALVRKEALDSVGRFDAANRMGAEDWQLWLRLAANGHRFRYVSRVLASYRVHGANMSASGVRLAMGCIHALERTRREYPLAMSAAGSACGRKLFELCFQLAWGAVERRDYALARRYFWKALRHRPAAGRAWSYAVLTSMPLCGLWLGRLRQALRRGDAGGRPCES